nr:glycosyltransferase [Synechococcus sp. HK05]
MLPELERQRSIVFVGRLVSDKGVDMLLRAFAALHRPQWRLSIVGDGPERKVLQALSQELQLGNSVSFLGAMQGEQLVRLLNQHELMVVPSRWREPFGVVALEGLACGCVVLASDGGGLPDAVGPAGLLFKRGDEVDLTRKLAQLMDDAPMRAMLRARTPAHLEAFQQQAVCDRYLAVLEEAFSSR